MLPENQKAVRHVCLDFDIGGFNTMIKPLSFKHLQYREHCYDKATSFLSEV